MEVEIFEIKAYCSSLGMNLRSALIRHVHMYESTETKSDGVAGEFARFLERATLSNIKYGKSNE